MSNPSLDPPEEHPARWPAFAIFSFGTLGNDTPGARRYHIRSAVALAVFVVLSVVWARFQRVSPPALRTSCAALLPGATFLYIMLEFRRYLQTLDELARRMHFEAMAWTYCVAIVAAMAIGGAAFALGWNVNPALLILLEPVRSLFLYQRARRF